MKDDDDINPEIREELDDLFADQLDGPVDLAAITIPSAGSGDAPLTVLPSFPQDLIPAAPPSITILLPAAPPPGRFYRRLWRATCHLLVGTYHGA